MVPADLRQIEMFLVLCEELSFTRTAERTGVTPSRVSQAIRALEAALGAQLFERTSRRVQITAVGDDLRRELAPAYTALERGFAVVRDSIGGMSGQLRLMMFLSIYGGPHLPEIIRSFQAAHPRCRVQTRDASFAALLPMLRAGETDMLAVRLPLHDPDLVIGPVLTRERRVLLVTANHELAARESVSWEVVGDYAVNDDPTAPREMIDAFIPPRTPSGRLIRRVRAGTNGPAMLAAVAAGEMVHPTVPSLVSIMPYPGLVSIPISDLPPSETALAWRAADTSPLIAAFAEVAREVLAREAPELLDPAPTAGTT